MVEVVLIQIASSEEIYYVHQELFVGLFDVGNDGDLLTVGPMLEKNLQRILRIVGG